MEKKQVRQSSIDWAEIHQRMDASRRAAEQGFTEEATKDAVLQQRARALARIPRTVDTTDDRLEVVEFLLNDERYGIETMYVEEVYPLHEITQVPCSAPFLFGIISLRGRILSVVNIKKFFDLPEKGLTDLNKVVVLRNEQMEFGVLADAVLGMRAISFNGLQSSLPTLVGIRGQYLKGVTQDRMVLLDGGRLLSGNNIVVFEEATT